MLISPRSPYIFAAALLWLGFALAEFAAAQSQQPADFEPVHSVASDETRVVLQGFALSDLPGLSHLQRRPIAEFLREFWRWETGRMSVAGVTVPNTRVGDGRNDPNGLFEQLPLWGRLAEIDLQFSDTEIKSGENSLGQYFYVTSDRNNAGLACVYFRQGIPVVTSDGSFVASDDIGGEISGYDCRAASDYSLAMLEETVRRMLDAITFR